MPNKLPDYPILFYIIRSINIFCILIYLFFMLMGVVYISIYLLVYFYIWILIVLSIIEIGYVINGDKELFKLYKKTNIFFLVIYFLTITIVLYPFIASLFRLLFIQQRNEKQIAQQLITILLTVRQLHKTHLKSKA